MQMSHRQSHRQPPQRAAAKLATRQPDGSPPARASVGDAHQPPPAEHHSTVVLEHREQTAPAGAEQGQGQSGAPGAAAEGPRTLADGATLSRSTDAQGNIQESYDYGDGSNRNYSIQFRRDGRVLISDHGNERFHDVTDRVDVRV